MSAWIVSKTHVDALVQACVIERIITPEQATELGKHLWQENHRSVNYRYGERKRTPAYEFRGVEAPLDDAVIRRNIECYWYQTCEHPENECYNAAEGKPLGLLAAALDARHGEGFEDQAERERGARLPWGIDRWDQVIVKA